MKCYFYIILYDRGNPVCFYIYLKISQYLHNYNDIMFKKCALYKACHIRAVCFSSHKLKQPLGMSVRLHHTHHKRLHFLIC